MKHYEAVIKHERWCGKGEDIQCSLSPENINNSLSGNKELPNKENARTEHRLISSSLNPN